MIRNSILEIFNHTWPMIVICTVILSSMRIIYIIKNKEQFIFYKEMMMLAFIIYIMCIFYVVTFQDVSWSTSNFIPFKEMFRYEFGSRLFFKNVVGNAIMFMPYGFFIGYFLKIDKKRTAIILSIITSLTIELTQLKIGRVFDIDDILLNVLGGLIGFCIYKFILKIKDNLPSFLKNRVFYNIMVLLLLTGFILYLTNYLKIGV